MSITGYNVSLIGQSRGRLLAVYVNGGQKVIMKRVSLQSNQDTYLCGHRGYHEDCNIHGTVDFIYAGGDNFFLHNNIIMENGGVICAPSTNITQHWGLVFDSCTIKDGEVFPEKASGYSLARPWQGEPRCYWLNTTMEILPSANGWRGMSKLVTHFYEYNSMDAKGNKLDLSKRGNSPSSINTYTPVLSDKEAEEFNVHNVLGGDIIFCRRKGKAMAMQDGCSLYPMGIHGSQAKKTTESVFMLMIRI